MSTAESVLQASIDSITREIEERRRELDKLITARDSLRRLIGAGPATEEMIAPTNGHVPKDAARRRAGSTERGRPVETEQDELILAVILTAEEKEATAQEIARQMKCNLGMVRNRLKRNVCGFYRQTKEAWPGLFGATEKGVAFAQSTLAPSVLTTAGLTARP